ncbi:MAG: Orotate phosphoribosyltransferase [Syntrophomonadaceae bacterium]|nr:Orotate phosphoribosyltransferase [Bacillota bacterium]
MLTAEKILEIFRATEVLQEGHFLLTSGRHSARYLQCARVFQYPEQAEKLCAELAARFSGQRIDVCLGPALGGVILAYETAKHLGCRAMFTEREQDGKMALRRGFRINPGERVLVLEDVVTTGGSVREVLELAGSLGGALTGVGAVVDRSGGSVNFGVPFVPLLRLEVETFSAADCPLCREGSAPVKPGSRK